MTHEPASKTINYLCLGLEETEVQEVVHAICTSPEFFLQELSLPVWLLNQNCWKIVNLISFVGTTLWDVQDETGLHGTETHAEAKDLSKVNIDKIIRSLTSLSDHASRIKTRVLVMERMLEAMGETKENDKRDNWAQSDHIQDQVEFLKQTMVGCRDYIDRFQRSNESQLQTVTIPDPS
jgi:hypothetical protein